MGLRLNDGNGNHVELTAPTLTSNVNLTLPNSIGTAGQFLQVGANGVTTWATALNLILQTDPSVTDVRVGTASTCTNPVVLSGTTPYSYAYQWQFQASGGSSFSDISGATSQAYTVPTQIGSVNAKGGQLRCAVTVSDSSTPAITLTATSNAVTIGAPFAQGTAGRAYRYDTNAGWVSITVNGSTTTDIRSQTRIGGSYNAHFIVADNDQVYAESSTDVYNTNVTANFGHNDYTSQGIRNVACCNNHDEVAAHCVLNDDIVYANYGSTAQSSWSSMRATWPGATCLWLAGMGWCTNNAFALIDDNGTERLINVWPRSFGGYMQNAWADFGLQLPNNEKLVQIAACGNDSNADTEAVVLLSDANKLYTVGNAANHLYSASNAGTWSSPALYNPTNLVPVEEIKSTGAYTTTNGEGMLFKGTDGHLYGETDDSTHQFVKLYDDVATVGIVNDYGGRLIVPLQDGTFTYLASASLGAARPYTWYTPFAAPSGLTVNTSGWTVWPTHNPGSCAAGLNGSMILAIPYS